MPLSRSTASGKCERCFDEYPCQYCPDQKFHNSVKLIEHLQGSVEHKDKEDLIFSCSLCSNKGFTSKSAYIHHLEQKPVHCYDLHEAACCGKYQDVDRLIRCENINITGKSHKVNTNNEHRNIGSTPMHCAAFHGYSRCLKVMLSWPECDPNVKDDVDGRTPVHLAAICGQESSLKILLKKGGRLDVKDANGQTPLDLVRSFQCIVVIVHYLRYCIKISTLQDDSSEEMLDKLVKLLEKFLHEHVRSIPCNPAECNKIVPNMQLTGISNRVSTDMLPYEVLARGEKCIEAFKKAMLDGKAPASRMKLTVVGEVGAGKTTLTRSLSGQPFKDTREETHGIETSSVTEMIDDTDLNCSWKVADPQDSHVDQAIATLLAQKLDLGDLPDVKDLLNPPQPGETRLPSLPSSPRVSSGDEIVRKRSLDLGKFPGLCCSIGARSFVLVTEEKVTVEGTPRKLPASLVAQALLEKKDTQPSVKVNIWDFAGHQLYEAMHHVFLNNRSLYLVVFSLLKMVECEKKCLATVHYWLNSIAVHTSQDTPVFLVGTHRAEVDDVQVERVNQLLVKHFEDTFGKRVVRKSTGDCLFAVENSRSQDDEGVACLISAIKREASKLSFVSEELPVKWLHCEEEILTYRKDPDSEKCLSIDELKELLVEKCNVQFTDEEFRSMLDFFHDSGLVILPDNMCDECTKPSIKNLVVMSPQYLVDVMTHIHDAPKLHELKRQFSQELKKLQKEGKVGSQLLEHVWDNLTKPKEVLIELLGQFNLVYPVHADTTSTEDQQETRSQEQQSTEAPSTSPGCGSSSSTCSLEYIIPCLIKGKRGESLEKHWKKIREEWSAKEHVFVFDFGAFLPLALFQYMLVRVFRRSQRTQGMEPILRRCGGIFSFSNKFVFRIELKLQDSQIWVHARCKNGGKFLDLVSALRDEVQDICRQNFKFLQFIYGPPCPKPCCPGARVDSRTVQRPCDSSSSDSQGSSDEEKDKNQVPATDIDKERDGRRPHILRMNSFNPPYWCKQTEVNEEDLNDWKPGFSCGLEDSFDDGDSADGSKCGCVGDCCLSFVADRLGDDWMEVGRKLGIEETKISNINADYKSQKERGNQVLLTWRNRLGNGAKWVLMVNALTESSRKDVADDFEQHCQTHNP